MTARDATLSTTVNTSLSCVVCGEGTPEEFLDLGDTALANKFLTRAELSAVEARYPLRVGFCETCGHVQLIEAVPPSLMFEEYLYVSSASDTLKAHLEDLSHLIVKRYQLGPDDLVIDVGCNDGTLLNGFRRYGVRTLGVDPAQNLAEFTRDKGIDRYIGFFNSKTAKDIVEKWGKASAITATNTFPHIPNLQDFIEGLRVTLKPDGVFVAEMHYLLDMLEQGAFDTIYHEHISYWALRPMKYLFEKNGMHIAYAERLPLHHGQLRVFVQPHSDHRVDPSVAEILEMECVREIHRPETFRQFAQKTLQIRQELGEMMSGLRSRGKRVVGYGAPAKGNTLLSFLGIGPESLEYIVDRSPLKQGLYTPGAHIPVVGPERLLSDQPDYVLLLAWNFVDEILRQQAEFRNRGGKFIIPVPQVQVV